MRLYAANCSEAHKQGVILELNTKTCFSNVCRARHGSWIKIYVELHIFGGHSNKKVDVVSRQTVHRAIWRRNMIQPYRFRQTAFYCSLRSEQFAGTSILTNTIFQRRSD